MSEQRQYRGKRVDNGEWVEGWYYRNSLRAYILKGLYEPRDIRCPAEVVPESVGQSTGLKDKEGAEIYEGDIAKGLWQIDKETSVKGVVVYYERYGMYAIETIQGGMAVMTGLCWESCEVIGNIHDNPELLEQDK